MTKQAELRGLLEQVESAEGPSREIDYAVGALSMVAGGLIVDAARAGDAAADRLIPKYTASLDAALAFTERALPGVKGFSDEPSVGWKFGVYRLTQPGMWTAWVRQHADDGVEVKQRTPALALVAAVLLALIEQESK